MNEYHVIDLEGKLLEVSTYNPQSHETRVKMLVRGDTPVDDQEEWWTLKVEELREELAETQKERDKLESALENSEAGRMYWRNQYDAARAKLKVAMEVIEDV